MRITLSSIIVDDQDRALSFYRDVLGFVEKENFPAGGARWITLASPEDPDGARISLEPAGYPFAKDYQAALKAHGIPLTAFEVKDIVAEHARLSAAGVVFRGPPSEGDAAMPKMATLDDGCGNFIMLYEPPAA
jgi:catechol 2,3-dioxygenase-like lactoylglutathione lyase family enzyme